MRDRETHLRLFDHAHTEPRQSKAAPQAYIELVRGRLLEAERRLFPPDPHLALIVVLPVVLRLIPPAFLLPPLQPPHTLPHDPHHLGVVALQKEEVGERLEVGVAVRVEVADRLGRDERDERAVVLESRE